VVNVDGSLYIVEPLLHQWPPEHVPVGEVRPEVAQYMPGSHGIQSDGSFLVVRPL
jgi:hypothetical protein